jgi:hypothetical protein
MRAWRRFDRSDAMHDTLEEIRRAGRLALKPVSSSPSVADTGEIDPPNQSPAADRDLEDAPDSNHHSMNSHSATETNP